MKLAVFAVAVIWGTIIWIMAIGIIIQAIAP